MKVTQLIVICLLSFVLSKTTIALEMDPHSYARPQEVLMTHLSWDASIDFDQKVITAVAEITFENKTDASHLYLDTKELKINKVTIDGTDQEAFFELGPGDFYLGKALKIRITPGATKVTIHYQTSPTSHALQWLDKSQTKDKKFPYLFTQSQAILARSWIPLQDTPGVKFTYDAQVQVPKGFMALMSASNPQQVSKDGRYSFEMKQPIPSYLMAMAVGVVEFKEIGERSGVYAEPSQIEAAAYEFGELESMIDAAERLYGDYRWERYDIIVLPPSFPFGGMENPRLTFATPTIIAGDRSLTSLIAHELAHSWSGNLVTNANWNDFWINEGFTVYFERRIMEEVYGKPYADMLSELGLQDLLGSLDYFEKEGYSDDTKLKLQLDQRNPDDGVTDIAYEKGCAFLTYIEHLVGRQKFDAFLNQYFEEFAFKSMTTEYFLEYLDKNLFDKYAIQVDPKLYEEWVYSKGIPQDYIKFDAARFNQVDIVFDQWLDSKGTKQLDTKEWSSHEWLYFLRKLPREQTIEDLTKLDNAYQFTQSGNSEILAEWFSLAIKNKYEPAYKNIEEFLIQVGRRKFLGPLYRALAQTQEGRQWARQIFEKAKPNYHFVAAHSIEQILK